MSIVQSTRKVRRSQRLEIEQLEDRIVPALVASTTDLWDVSRGTTVTANSAVIGAPFYSFPFVSDIRNMFGNAQAGVIEPGNTLFQDFQPAGTVDFVEWQTASAITLRNFHLFAAHDGAPRNINQRGFSRFTLYAQNPSTLAFEKIFELFPSTQYGNTPAPANGYTEGTPGGNALILSVNVTPTVAQKFRAEFVQQGAPSTESGPRILELDGFDTFDLGATFPNATPVANPGGPYTVPEGGNVVLSGAGSSDPDGVIASYQWDLNYNGATFDVDATGVAPTFSAAGIGGPASRTIALRVLDNVGASALATSTVMITNVPPTGSADNATVSVNEGQSASNGGACSDPADPVTLSTSVGAVINNGDGTWSWSFATSDGPEDSQSVTIFADDGAGPVAVASFNLVVNNVAPTGSADNATVTVYEGRTASNTGAYSDPADPVTLSASVGVVINNGNGTWSWSFATSDGPDDNQTVTIFADDGAGAVPIASFGLIVNNIAPTGSAANATVTVNEGQTASNSGAYSDPSDPVTLFASVGAVINNGNGTWSWSFATSDGPDDNQTVTIFADDGAGTVPIAIFNLFVNNVAPTGTVVNASVTVNAGTTANNSGTYADPGDPVTLNASVGAVTDLGGGAWSWSIPTTGLPGGSQSVTIFANDGSGATAIASFQLVVNHLPQSQTIAFSTAPAQIALNGNGVFNVRIPSTANFSVSSLDLATLRLNGSAAIHSTFADFDRDGDVDLILQFRRLDFVDDYVQRLFADIAADGDLDSLRQVVRLNLTGKTKSGVDVSGSIDVEMSISVMDF